MSKVDPEPVDAGIRAQLLRELGKATNTALETTIKYIIVPGAFLYVVGLTAHLAFWIGFARPTADSNPDASAYVLRGLMWVLVSGVLWIPMVVMVARKARSPRGTDDSMWFARLMAFGSVTVICAVSLPVAAAAMGSAYIGYATRSGMSTTVASAFQLVPNVEWVRISEVRSDCVLLLSLSDGRIQYWVPADKSVGYVALADRSLTSC